MVFANSKIGAYKAFFLCAYKGYLRRTGSNGKHQENLLKTKPDEIRFLLSMHKAKLKDQLVSKCLMTMKLMPAYNTLIGYLNII